MKTGEHLDYFYGDDVYDFTFFRLPKLLFVDERFCHISCEAKLLYGLMLDRLQLSIRKGWFDEHNRAYIRYSVEQIMSELNCGNKKAGKILKELDEETGVGLIERMRVGLGQANVYYVKNFTTGTRKPTSRHDVAKQQFITEQALPKDPQSRTETGFFQKCQNDTSGSVKTTLQEVSKRHFKKCQNDTSGSVKMTLQEMSKGHANKNKPNNTEPYETDSFLLSFPEEEIPPLKDERTIPDGTTEGQDRLPGDIYDSYFRRSLKYDHYMQTLEHGRRDMYAQYVELIIDTVRDNSDFVEIGRGRVPYEAVRARFMQLTPDDVLSVMDKISNYSGERIVNMHKYVLTALFREPVISGAAISQQVAFDLYGDDAGVYDGCA